MRLVSIVVILCEMNDENGCWTVDVIKDGNLGLAQQVEINKQLTDYVIVIKNKNRF